MKNILNSFFELFFPRLCVCCQNRLNEGEQHICISCHLRLPKTDHLRTEENKLEQNFSGRFPFIRIGSYTYFSKGGIGQKIIHDIKYRNNKDLAIYIGKLCGREIKKQNAFTDIDFIVPVPLHKNRLKKRGYNQAELIAEGISQVINKPVNSSILIRNKNNPSQTKHNRLGRWENTEGIFDITDKSVFKDKHILLIDDVITTGSTIEVCVKAILKCSDARVSIYAIGSVI